MQKLSFSTRIPAARKKLGLSQAKAAALWGIKVATLRDWEQGRRRPHGLYREKLERILRKIEKATGLSQLSKT